MLTATIRKVPEGYTATFQRLLPHAPAEVWSYLTSNDKLREWFPELRMRELGLNGLLTFDMGDGSFEDMRITDYEEGSLLEYEWGEDRVRFELSESGEDAKGCRLVLVEKIGEITAHTPKDLAGWHVCLDVIAALLDGRTIEDRQDEWSLAFPQYKLALEAAAQQ